MARAARGRRFLCVFHEGLAVLAERTWRLEIRRGCLNCCSFRAHRSIASTRSSPQTPVPRRAYTLAAAFVRI